MKPALLVIDVQNDFCPGGALAVKDGDKIVPLINKLIPLFETIVYSRDWHPQNHISFANPPQFTDQSWPVHCVANTRGADFHPDLLFTLNSVLIEKGTNPNEDAYSAFQGTSLSQILHKLGVDTVFTTGLATDYCVKATALDALADGFQVYLLQDACKGVDNPSGTVVNAINEMSHAGVKIINAGEVETVL
ncbi:MAG TPA: nicotinamidase [Firmicutes bacterium]|jgi:nicotinamidase/pyrazinamidase|nr:nicotinamidase [Bacillota bacterium]